MLRRFQIGQAGVPEQIEAAMQAGDTELAVRLAHTLRGTAATLGATGLQHLAGELESSLKQASASWRQRLGETQAQLAPLIAALVSALPAATLTSSMPSSPFDAGLLDVLVAQIDSFDSMATETVERLRSQLGAGAPSLLALLDEHLMNFAFDEAAALMPDLRAQLMASAGPV